jgi:O-antigen/teichoic acid export membrane protein
MVGTFLRRGAVFLLIPLYTAFLRPDAYAILAFVEVIVSLTRIIFTLGLDTAAFRFYFTYQDIRERHGFYSSIWLFQLAVSGLLTILLASAGGRTFGRFIEQIPFDPYIRVALWIAFFRAGFEFIAMELLRAKGAARTYAWLSLVSFVVSVGLQVYMVAGVRAGVDGAVMGMLWAAVIMAAFYSLVIIRECGPRPSIRFLSPALRYSLPLVPHFLAHWLLSLSDRWILERNVSLADLGVYSLGDQIRQGYNVIPWSANSALMPTFGRASKDHAQRGMIPKLVTYYMLGIGGFGLAVVLFTPLVLPLIAPPEYSRAVSVVPWLILGAVFYGAYFMPMNVLAQTLGVTSTISAITLLAGGINVGLNLLLVPHFGIMAAAVNTAAGYGVLLALMQRRAQRKLPLAYESQRLIKGGVAMLGVYGLSVAVPQVDPAWANWILRFLLLGLFPLFLAGLRFFDSPEIERFRQVWANLRGG